jgi:hypothetical protein
METEEEEIDTLHRQIYQLVVNDIPKAVGAYLDAVRERRKLLNEVSKVIEPINVKKFTLKSFLTGVLLVLMGELTVRSWKVSTLVIAGAIAYTSKGLEEEDKTPISFGTSLLWDDEFDPGRRAAAIRDKFMYDVARRAVVERKPDLLLLDGPLIPNAGYIPHSDDSEAYKEDYENMMDALFSLLDLVRKEHEKRGMLMACVVKRVRSTRYSTLLNLPKPLRDSAILNPILKMDKEPH